MEQEVRDYVIEGVIGQGGMGIVLLGRHKLLDTSRAIKRPILPLPDATTRTRFIGEAKLESQMDHPSIVRVLELFDEGGTPYIVMEYYPLGSLNPLVGRLDEQQVGRVVTDVLRGLDHAHQRGIIHRDIKPANLMRADDGHVKIADFGIARALGRATSRHTLSNEVDGAIGYMPPEAFSGVMGTSGDLYAVGVVVFELLTGAVPFADETRDLLPEARGLYQAKHSAPALQEITPGIDRDLAHWVASLLHRDPDKRPNTAREALAEFQDIAGRLWGPDWESRTLLPTTTDHVPGRPQAPDPRPDHELESWSSVTKQAPAGDLARHALLKPRNLGVLGFGVAAAFIAREVTHVLRPWWAVIAIAVLYLGSCAVTFFDVAEADDVRRREAAHEALEAPSEDAPPG